MKGGANKIYRIFRIKNWIIRRGRLYALGKGFTRLDHHPDGNRPGLKSQGWSAAPHEWGFSVGGSSAAERGFFYPV